MHSIHDVALATSLYDPVEHVVHTEAAYPDENVPGEQDKQPDVDAANIVE